MKPRKDIRLIILDVDGTMTDGGVYIDNNRIETKKFSIKDGCGIVIAHTVGLQFMILTGRESNCVSQRAEELKIEYVFQNVKNKAGFISEFLAEKGIEKGQVAYIGDDLNDYFAMRLAGYTACPSDAAPEIREQCDLVLKAAGGDGVVREFVEKLLKENGLWQEAIQRAFGGNGNLVRRECAD